MNSHHLLIQKSADSPDYLDGYNGGTDWEWTTNRKTAWRLRREEANRKLALVKETFPNALIVEA